MSIAEHNWIMLKFKIVIDVDDAGEIFGETKVKQSREYGNQMVSKEYMFGLRSSKSSIEVVSKSDNCVDIVLN